MKLWQWLRERREPGRPRTGQRVTAQWGGDGPVEAVEAGMAEAERRLYERQLELTRLRAQARAIRAATRRD